MLNSFSCPVLPHDRDIITLAHGSGGVQTSRLIEEIFLPAFANNHLNLLHDGALLNLPANQIVFSTDSYVVQPVFFPGGDIGKLAVTGTMNDLAMCGAKPYYLSCGFIIEEGFFQSDLQRIVASMKTEADASGVQIVTGDTKVIERQTGKNIFINTSGIGVSMVDYPINPRQIKPHDAIVLSGDIGRHGMAIMAQREALGFSSPLISDCTSLFPIVQALISEGILIHCLRDLTRGGLATALVECSESAKMDFAIQEPAIPISDPVKSACEILGFDPLYVANEGRFIAFIPEDQAHRAVQIIQRFPAGENAMMIGHALSGSPTPSTTYQNSFGTSRTLHKLSGDQLPRIC
jgi:hydrogenase expression/formation protein HypE